MPPKCKTQNLSNIVNTSKKPCLVKKIDFQSTLEDNDLNANVSTGKNNIIERTEKPSFSTVKMETLSPDLTKDINDKDNICLPNLALNILLQKSQSLTCKVQ